MSTIELIIVTIIISITAGFTIPNLHSLWQNHALHQATQHYIKTIKYAYRQAILKNEELILCGTSMGFVCDGAWQNGAVLFVNKNGKKIPLSKFILLTLPKLPQGITVKVSAFPSAKYFIFNPNGLLGTSNGSISLSNQYQTEKFSISRTGRINIFT